MAVPLPSQRIGGRGNCLRMMTMAPDPRPFSIPQLPLQERHHENHRLLLCLLALPSFLRPNRFPPWSLAAACCEARRDSSQTRTTRSLHVSRKHTHFKSSQATGGFPSDWRCPCFIRWAWRVIAPFSRSALMIPAGPDRSSRPSVFQASQRARKSIPPRPRLWQARFRATLPIGLSARTPGREMSTGASNRTLSITPLGPIVRMEAPGLFSPASANVSAFAIEGSAVPEPSSIVLFGIGAIGSLAYAWKSRFVRSNRSHRGASGQRFHILTDKTGDKNPCGAYYSV